MSPTIWMHDQGLSGGMDPAVALRAALAQAGVTVGRHKSDADPCGVVLFTEVSAELPTVIEELSRHGLDRVVAVATGEEQVAGAVPDRISDLHPPCLAECLHNFACFVRIAVHQLK